VRFSIRRRHGLASLDGVYVGHTGGTFEVFDPPWWHVRRWWRWWRSKRAKGEVEFKTLLTAGGEVVRVVRVWEVVPVPRRRVEDQFRIR
jgi:hypothetical protein